MEEFLHFRGIETTEDPTKTCQIHHRTTEDLMEKLEDELRLAHGKGGITICRGCIYRLKDEADLRRGIKTQGQ